MELKLKNAGQIKETKKVLDFFLKSNKNLFQLFFINELAINLARNLSKILEGENLIKKIELGFRSKVRIYPLKGKFIITDFPSLKERNRVFPIYDDESAFFAQHLAVKKDDVVLDLCTGSGILAIFAAEKALKVYATDINVKALNYAKFNAMLNNVEDKIHFLQGDLYTPASKHKFDLITANPPFIPSPPEAFLCLHSDGGLTGLEITKKIIIGLDKHLKNRGRFQMVTLSLGDRKGPFELIQFLKQNLGDKNFKVTLTHLYKNSLQIDPFYTSLFKNHQNYYSWKKYLKERGLTNQYYLFVNIENGSTPFSLSEERLQFSFSKTRYSGCWESRLNRFCIPKR